MFDVTLITPTADQPTGISLCETWMRRQTVWDSLKIQWIIADDGEEAIKPSLGQFHVRRTREPGCTPAQSLSRNLLAAIPLVRGRFVVIIEHDDWYRQDHIELMLQRIRKEHAIGSENQIVYYHVGRRSWKEFAWGHPSLCQTALRFESLPMLEQVARKCAMLNAKGVDNAFWSGISRITTGEQTVVGIKGLPGRLGIGIGHQPGDNWANDPLLLKLQALIGVDAELYRSYREVAA